MKAKYNELTIRGKVKVSVNECWRYLEKTTVEIG